MYVNLDLKNDDIGEFLEWLKKHLDEEELKRQDEIIDFIIDVVVKPYRYDKYYQKYRMELESEQYTVKADAT